MKVRIQSGGITSPPEERTEVDSLVVMTDEGDPVLVGLNLEGRVWLKTADDPGFAEAMESLGFNKRNLPLVDVVKV